ncbi:HdeD family acid-resistance protein [Pseudogemmobacter sonorensis]|uniref:HdeD family acid-resistance protein n=1 Tax=Pseudogemmobacter sonorensis TaxID=2989681 RepID=UPI00367B0DE1
MKSSTISIIAGVLALLGGVAALVFPLPASLAVTVFAGVAFVVSGALGLFAAFSDKTLPSRGWIGLLSGLQLVLGVWILANPLAGLVSLTLAAGILFLASGIGRVVAAFGLKGTRLFWALLLTGVLSALLGLYAIFFLPSATPVLLGTLFAVELISVGAALIALGVGLKKLP